MMVMTVVMTTLPLVTKLVVNGAAAQESRVPGHVLGSESLVGGGLGMGSGSGFGRKASMSVAWGDAVARRLVGNMWVSYG